jgi:hypothetical protein
VETTINNKTEIDLILLIMNNEDNYSYFNPTGGEIGTIIFGDSNKRFDVFAMNYEAAFLIREIRNKVDNGDYTDILKLKMHLMNW